MSIKRRRKSRLIILLQGEMVGNHLVIEEY